MKVTDIASREEFEPFTKRSDWKAIGYITFNWTFIAAIFFGVSVWTNPLTILVGIALLGGRQLAFAALLHDCGHRALFSQGWANAVLGQWLCAYPILSDQPRYAAGHQKHHAFAGTRKDPDLPNYQSYPISRERFRRKIIRDLTGQTGWKALRATWRRGQQDLAKAPWNGNALAGHLIMNGLLLGVLIAFGEALLFLMWPIAYLTAYMLIARLRQVAEHGAVPDLFDLDPRKNTRTTRVRWWEKLFVAPFHLNYHLEHHLQANIPCYNLPAFHRFLVARGFYDETEFPNGYRELYATTVLS
ncbi:MAG: fatty acid desaturase family protein [bacterium]|nr:fatty acid desaturase [Deltaproteobacteria bacterium]MCP4908326.1 fatty acid desaturase family protein [bacterium]